MCSRIMPILAVGFPATQGCASEQPSAEAYPPAAGQRAVLDTRVPGWETSAWLADGSFCVRAARADGRHEAGRENEFVFANVSVTMFSETATAAVHSLPTTNSQQVGAYAVWLPRSGTGRDGMHISDITAVVGRNAAGEVVARLD